jgi:hypothetical protein
MLESLITSKTRIKLLLKFFLNSNTTAYLRSLESEFGESTNAIRLELNRFEQAGLLTSFTQSNRKLFAANTSHPLFSNIQSLLRKHVGIDQIIEHVVNHLGDVDKVYLSGAFARGVESENIEILIVGNAVDTNYLNNLVNKAATLIQKNILYTLLPVNQSDSLPSGNGNDTLLLLWQKN